MIATRPMGVADVPAACALLNEIIRIGGTTAFEDEMTEAEFAAHYVTGADLVCCHVALDAAGAVAGFQWLGVGQNLPAACADIASFARVKPKLKGVGRAMFDASVATLRAKGYSQINAKIRADNTTGLGYYSAMGFVDHAVVKSVPLRDGRPMDRIVKRYDLGQSAQEFREKDLQC